MKVREPPKRKQQQKRTALAGANPKYKQPFRGLKAVERCCDKNLQPNAGYNTRRAEQEAEGEG
jgi:hypothetical protein